jgi:hypothetical protein
MDCSDPLGAVSEAAPGRCRYCERVMSTDHLDDLRRRLAGRTGDGSTNDRVTTDRLATMRRRLSELEQTSENSTDDAEVMAVEEEAHEIMAGLENVRDLRPSEDG